MITNTDKILSTLPKGLKIYEILERAVVNKEKYNLEILRVPKPRFQVKIFSILFITISNGLFTNKIFGTNALNLKYRGIKLGLYCVNQALRNSETFKGLIYYYFYFVKSIYLALHKIKVFEENISDIKVIVTDDPCYTNGVYLELALKHNIPVYNFMYPFKLTRFDSRQISDATDLTIVPKFSTDEYHKGGKEIYKSIYSDTSELLYMKGINFDNTLKNIDFREVYAVVYAHSFTDAQHVNGGNGSFLNLLEWLKYTLKILKGKNVIVKAHPNFFSNKLNSDIVYWDKKIWRHLLTKISKYKNLQIIDWPLQNSFLLDKIPKNTIMISHHGNALLEAGGKGFKCISCTSSTWKNYDLFNTWESKFDYFKLLNNPNELKYTIPVHIYNFLGCRNLHKNSFFSPDHPIKIISKYFNLKEDDIVKNPLHLDCKINEELVSLISKKIYQYPS